MKTRLPFRLPSIRSCVLVTAFLPFFAEGVYAGVAEDILSINDVSVTEGNSGTVDLTFTVTRSSNGAEFTVDYATANGAATAPSDFTAASGTLTFTAGGDLTKTVTVAANGDALGELDETFVVNLTNLAVTAGAASITDEQGQGTILDDDSVAPAITTEPEATLTVVPGNPFTLTVVATGNPAPAYQWYKGAPGVITSPVSGGTSATLTTATDVDQTYWVRVTNFDGPADSAAANVTVETASNALLSSLTLSAGAVSPAFAPVTRSYVATEANETSTVDVTPTVVNPGSTLTVAINGGGAAPVTSGSPVAVSLSPGSNSVVFTVTAPDTTTTKNYTLTIIRGPQVYTSANRDVLDPHIGEWPVTGVVQGGTRFTNLGLQGVGRFPADSKDPVTGESIGSVSDMQLTGFTKNGDGSYSGTLETLPDRGYNSDTIFSNYAARLNTFSLTFTPYTAGTPTTDQDQVALTFSGSTRFTYDHDNDAATDPVFTTGLLAAAPPVSVSLLGSVVPVAPGASIQSDGEVTNRLTVDAEGLIFDSRPGKTGTGWVSDEYGAFIYHFNADKKLDGVLKLPAALVPSSAAGTPDFSADPPAGGRRINQGMEGLAQSPDGTRLFALLQSATLQDSGSGNQGRSNARLVVYDITSGSAPVDPIAQYVIQLPRADVTGSNANGTSVNRNCAQSSILALNNQKLLILARDGNGRGAAEAPVFKSIILADLAAATNIDGTFDAKGSAVAPGGVLRAGVTPVPWTEALNMLGKLGASTAEVEKFGLNLNAAPGDVNTLCEKWEALSLVSAEDPANPNDYFLFVANDNDFLTASGAYLDETGTIQAYDAGLENDTMVLVWRVRLESTMAPPTVVNSTLSLDANASPTDLISAAGVAPTGGIFSGSGVVGNTFDPAVADLGANTVTYTLNGQSVSFTVTVAAPPTLSAVPSHELTLSLQSAIVLSEDGTAGSPGGAEIPAFDPVSKRAFAASNVGIQVVDMTNPAAPVRLAPIDPIVEGLGTRDVSHVLVRNGVLAVSLIASPDKTLPGTVAFFSAVNGQLLGSATVGANPDQLIFTPDGTKVLVANEGELALSTSDPAPAVPDPDGSVSIIDVSGGFASPPVTTATFTAWNGQEATLRANGIRVFPGKTAAQDLEPEYIAISPDGATAMVVLQEASAVAVLDVASATFTAINPLGLKNYERGVGDFSDRDGAGNAAAIELKAGSPAFGMFMPDGIAGYQSAGQAYYITANEGDDRDDFLVSGETIRVGSSAYDLDNTRFPNESTLKTTDFFNRLTVCDLPGLRGDIDGDGDIDRILSYGGRSFSILDASGKRIFDSGDVIDRIIATYYPHLWDDTRSDNKSAEPEGVSIAVIGGKTYAFIGLERAHSAMIFDVTNPADVKFITLAWRAGDLNPEGMLPISAADSPTGKPLLLVANEVSYTLTTYEIATEQAPMDLQILHYYGESGLLGIQTAPIMGAMIDRLDDEVPNTVIIGEGDSFIPGPWLVGGADPSLNRIIHTGTFTGSADTSSVPLAQADIAIMNAFGTTVSALGNHEFDLGSPVLASAIAPASSTSVGNWSGAQFPIISANLDFAADSSLRGFADSTVGGTISNNYRGNEVSAIKAKIAPFAVKTIGGQKVGFVGASTFELLSKSSPNGTKPLDDGNPATSDLEEVAAYLQGAIDSLTAAGVNKIIMVDQLDTLQRNKDLAPLLTGVDVMVAGGGHERMGDATDVAVPFNGHDADFVSDTYPILTAGADGKPTLIVTTDTEYSYLGRLVVQFDSNGELITGALDPAVNGAYAASEATLQAVYGTTDSAATIIAASTIGSTVKAITDAINAVITVKDSTVFGYTKVYLEGDRVFGRTQEVNLGDITADANAVKARAALGLPANTPVFSLKNGGGIRASLGSVAADGSKIPPLANPFTGKPAGGISQLDIENALRFDNKMMVFETTPAGLLGILNFAAGLSSGPTAQSGGYPQIGNVRFSYDSSRPAGQKVRSVALIDDNGAIVSKIAEDGAVLPGAPATIPCVALNFTANGGDGYPIKNNPANPANPAAGLPGFGSNFRYLLDDGTVSDEIAITEDFTAAANVPANSLGEQKAFSDFLAARHATPATAFDWADTPVPLDQRIQQIAFRADEVLFSSIEAWRLANFGSPDGAGTNEGNLDDADSDGVNNLFEFAFGTNPGSNTSGPLELVYNGTFAGNGLLDTTGQPITAFEPIPNNVDFRAIFIRRKDYRAAGLIYTPQFSANLSVWVDSTAEPTVLADDGTWQVVSVPYPRAVAGRKARFFRIQVTLP